MYKRRFLLIILILILSINKIEPDIFDCDIALKNNINSKNWQERFREIIDSDEFPYRFEYYDIIDQIMAANLKKGIYYNSEENIKNLDDITLLVDFVFEYSSTSTTNDNLFLQKSRRLIKEHANAYKVVIEKYNQKYNNNKDRYIDAYDFNRILSFDNQKTGLELIQNLSEKIDRFKEEVDKFKRTEEMHEKVIDMQKKQIDKLEKSKTDLADNVKVIVDNGFSKRKYFNLGIFVGLIGGFVKKFWHKWQRKKDKVEKIKQKEKLEKEKKDKEAKEKSEQKDNKDKINKEKHSSGENKKERSIIR